MKRKLILISAFALLAALLISTTAFAEGEEDPAPAIPEAIVEAAEPAPVEETYYMPADTDGEAAEVPAAADPYFKVGLTTYQFSTDTGYCSTGDLTCFDGDDPVYPVSDAIQDSIRYLYTYSVLPTDGKIYVEDGTYNGFEVDANINPYLATLKGVQSENGSAVTTLNGDVTVNNTIAGFIFSGFSVNGYLKFYDNTGSLLISDVEFESTTIGEDSLQVGFSGNYHNGPVSLINVKADNGAAGGAEIYAISNLSILNSSFDHNTNAGLWMFSKSGTITLKGVSASGNGAAGIYSPEFTKSVTLQHVTANDNAYDGFIMLDPEDGSGLFKADYLYANGNGSYGIQIQNIGIISLNEVYAADNGAYGLNVSHAVTTGMTLVNSRFDNNHSGGFFINTIGNLALTSVHADGNVGYGAYIYNKGLGATGSVTITSPVSAGFMGGNSFSGNQGWGLRVDSTKAVTLMNLDAMDNTGYGVWVYTPGNLVFSKNLANWANGVDNNGNHGLYLDVGGSVTLNGTGASNNDGYGAYFYNVAKNVSVTGGRFSYNNQNGLYIQSSGTVTLTDVRSASGNDWEWDMANYYYGIYIDTSFGAGNVTVKGTSQDFRTEVSNNSMDGLFINSNGAIAVSNVYASGNMYHGVSLNNMHYPVIKTMSVAQVDSYYNGGVGLKVNALGTVTLQNISTVGNDMGTWIEACESDGKGGCLNIANVTIKGANYFSDNNLHGLGVFTKGAVTITHMDVINNGFGGTQINNAYYGSVAPVNLGGPATSYIDNNGGYGLRVESYGNITLKTFEVQNNYDIMSSAAYLENTVPGTPRSVTVINSSFNGNEATGLSINSNGPVVLNNVSAFSNSIYSDWIYPNESTNGVQERLTSWTGQDEWWFSALDTDTFTITLTSDDFIPVLTLFDEYGNFYTNDDNPSEDDTAQITVDIPWDGDFYLVVNSRGNPVGFYELTFGGPITPVSAIDGVHVITTGNLLVTSPTSASSFNYFDQNNHNGLYAEVGGTATLANAGASNNGFHGAYIESGGNVLVNNNHPSKTSTYSQNESDGLYIMSHGNITLSNRLWLNANGENGAVIDNGSAATPKNITVANVWAAYNGESGLQADASGNVTVTSLIADDNNGTGLDVSADGNFTMLGKSTLSYNNNGLHSNTQGNVTLAGITLEHNTNGLVSVITGSGKTVLFKNIIARFNSNIGVGIESYSKVTLNTVYSTMNGDDGFYLMTRGNDAVLQNCVAIGNEGDGIEHDSGGGVLLVPGTFYFGNDTDGDGDLNINYY